MKSIILSILCFCLATNLATAQWKSDFTLKIRGGYEHNIYKSASNFQEGDEVLSGQDLMTSGLFEGVGFSGSFVMETTGGRWKLNYQVAYANFHTEVNANLFDGSFSASYRKKYAKGKYWELAPSFLRRSRQGTDESDAVLRTTLSYTRVNVPFHWDFYLGDKKWFKTETGYTFKSYDQSENGEQVSYHSAYTGASFSKKWEQASIIQKITFSGQFEHRLYTDLIEDEEGEQEEFIDEEDEDFIDRGDIIGLIRENRQWTFLRANVEWNSEYKNSPFEFTVGLYSTFRLDSENRFGYSEFGPGLRAKYQLGRLSLSGSTSYRHRVFSNLNAADDNGSLQYQYFRSSLRLSTPIGKKKSWYLQGNAITRVSNRNVITSRAFRGYNYSLVEAGISIKL